jgi:hypothetical protein
MVADRNDCLRIDSFSRLDTTAAHGANDAKMASLRSHVLIFRPSVAVWVADAHRGDGKRFVVRAEEKLTAFVELELAIRAASA